MRCSSSVSAPLSSTHDLSPTNIHAAFANRFDAVEQVSKELRQRCNLHELMALGGASESEVQRVIRRVYADIKEHMTSIRAKVNELWQARKYKELNAQLVANERFDKAFRSDADVCAPGWAREIQDSVEAEIDRIAAKGRRCLHGKCEEEAEALMRDFALQLIYLGRILDDLPRFKDACRHKMTALLDLCHEQGSWGHCYVFKLGMLLGQGKLGDLDKEGKVVAEDDRIGKTIVAEFKHFKVLIYSRTCRRTAPHPLGG